MLKKLTVKIKKMNSLYITTPIFYVNGLPHIGHWYTSIVTDIVYRANFLANYKARIQTGTDEHGQKIQKTAEDLSESVMNFCNKISAEFFKMSVYSNCACSYQNFSMHNFNCLENSIKLLNEDKIKLFNNGKNFIRTTEGREFSNGKITQQSIESGRHIKYVLKFWEKLKKNGWIYKGKYSGWYAIRDEAFYSEDEIIDGKAPSGAPVEWKEEECYFFKLSAMQKILLAIYQNYLNFVYPNEKFTEVISFVAGAKFVDAKNGNFKDGSLLDLCVSRPNLTWGIPVPDDEKQTIYVWLDALTNYISALEENEYNELWLNRSANSTVVHIVGKDILRFHAVYWPAFLIAQHYTLNDIENTHNIDEIVQKSKSILPDCIVSHGWWTNNGEKMSKSLNNTVDPYIEIEFLKSSGIANEIATDYFRYFMAKAMPFGNDGDYSRQSLITTINSDLANNIGNLASRTVAMCTKYLDGKYSLKYANNLQEYTTKYVNCIEKYGILQAINIILEIANNTNLLIEQQKPWELAKSGKITEIANVLNNALSQIFIIGVLLQAFCPEIAGKILNIFTIDFAIKFNEIEATMNAKQSISIVNVPNICPRVNH